MDGITKLLDRGKMSGAAKKMRDFYVGVPGAPIYQTEFGFFTLKVWQEQGLPENPDLPELFGFDVGGSHSLGQLGWCEGAFMPEFPVEVLEDQGDYELVQDTSGRGVKYFKGVRNGYMPEFVTHPVVDEKSWRENCKWRMQPDTPGRFDTLDERMEKAKRAAARGDMIQQNLVGGYMYLRSLIGPGEVPFMFYDNPALIHDCMQTWFDLADAVIAKHQEHVTLDEIYIGEDICYNHGPLISPDMIKEFLFPYYRQLLGNAKKRQIDKDRHLYFRVDSDGNVAEAVPLYMSIGMDVMSPFEVASGCDVVEYSRKYPDLRMSGGIDKRILAESKDAISREVERIMPVLTKKGGYMPTCDHGVPEEVPLENYLHYRKLMSRY